MLRILYTVTVLELFVGGGGRLLEFGPITLRMVLFVMCFFASLGLLIFYKDNNNGPFLALGLTMAYILIHALGLLNGAMKGTNATDLISDAQPSLYWMLAPFFAVVLSSVSVVRYTAKLVCMSGVLLAVMYLMAIIGLFFGWLDFDKFYGDLDATGEFFFRGENFFFYKGFLYLAVSSVFLMLARSRLSKLGFTLVVIALTLTLTRGFVISTAIAIIFMLFGLRRWKSLAVAIVSTIVAVLFVWVYLPDMSTGFSEQREISNNVRLDDLNFILENANISTLLIGEGFGSYINERLNIENSFLWIWWKLGVIGLIFWLSPLVMAFAYYRQIHKDSSDYYLACALFYSIFLVYIQTGSNPFLNNPIGLSFVLISLFSLRTLADLPESHRLVIVPERYSNQMGMVTL